MKRAGSQRVRQFLLIASLALTGAQGLSLQSAKAATIGSGNCIQTVDSTVDVAVVESGGYCYVAFKSGSRTWNTPTNVSAIDYLVVAGGGSGGARHGGGGGAGGLLKATSVSISNVTSLSITVGTGGAAVTPPGNPFYAAGLPGNNSSLSKSAGTGTFSSVTAIGGGGGEAGGAGAQSGGSGGGAQSTNVSSGTAGQGNNGGTGGTGTISGASNWWAGGGGGAGAPGGDGSTSGGGNGGTGAIWVSAFTNSIASSLGLALTNQVDGNQVYFAGGGGGAITLSYTPGSGGLGGGGAAVSGNNTGVSGAANSGGGGGGTGCCDGGTTGAGGSGIVLIRYVPDTTAPTISQTTFSTSPSSGWYILGEAATVQITYSETVTVTGSPRLPISGLTGKYFTYASGSGSKVLLFSYVVAVGDFLSAGAGVSSNSLALNGGTIKDLALNDASLDNQALTQNGLNKFDGIVPTVSSIAVAANGNSVVITLSETSSSVALTGTLFNLTVNSTRDTVTAVNQSGTKATLTLTFGIVAGDSVSLTYTDPNSTNDTYVLQDVAGNDIPTFTTAVTNNSVATSNTSISLAVTPDTTTAIYRLNNSIVATVSTAGKVDFKLQGKYLAGCRNVSTTGSSPITATCTWKPSIHNSVTITATFKPSGAGFTRSNATPLSVFVLKRTNTR